MEKTNSLKQHFASIKKIASRKVLPLFLCTLMTTSIAGLPAAAATTDDPYTRTDPGPGKLNITLAQPTNAWAGRVPNDYRVPSDYGGSTFEMIKYPFADSEGKNDVLQINYVNQATTTFGGISLQSALDKTVDVPTGSNIEFDVYYPKSAQGKYMRWRLITNGDKNDTYLRDYDYTNLNPDWIGNYKGETWLKVHHSITATTGSTSSISLELHGENSRPKETGTLIVANMRITQPDPNGVALPNVVNTENQSTVTPIKDLYNKENGLFTVGTLLDYSGVSDVGGRHYNLFVDGNALKAEPTHPKGPDWLKSVDGAALSGATTTPGTAEYSFPDAEYKGVRDAGKGYQLHGHVMAWYNQAPQWMTQIVPATLTQGFQGTAAFYGLGNNVKGQVKVSKDMAKRVQYNHIVTVMRHFLTTDEKYGSSEARGIIPFHSWDILNEEVHESRHSENIPKDPNGWKNSLKNTNWLAAMSDDDITGDDSNHYVYLLFKYAHIAAPNEKMAAAYKANYASLPDYMKLDGNDNNGSIDKYITNTPPKLTYNDYGLATRTKARTVYNMVKELNTAWKSDPLYDGRPLIEDIGIQGHDSVGKTLASDNQYAVALYASLVDQGLLSGISYSELDLKMLTDAPGGGSKAPATLNVKQSDALGYEYALLYKMFTKFAPYIDHIINWGSAGAGWGDSYLLFDGDKNANAGYYGVMKPDKFIQGHTYLDSYFKDEYTKVSSASIDLGDLGTYSIKSAADAANAINTITVAKDATTLALPTVPVGCTAAIYTSSKPTVIGLDGTITPPAEDTTVDLVLRITKANDKTTALTKTISVVVPARSADKSNLNTEVSNAASLTEGDYTAASWSVFKQALDSAKALLANTNAKQAEVDAARTTLADAEKNLIKLVMADPQSKITIDISKALLPDSVTSVSVSASTQATDSTVAQKVKELLDQTPSLGKADKIVVTDIKLLDQNGNPIKDFKPGTRIKVKIPIPAGMSGNLKVLWYDPSTNKVVDMLATQQDGFLVFETDHFSYYAVAQFAATSTSSTSTNTKTGDTTSPILYVALVSSAMLSAAYLLISRKKRTSK